MSAFWTFIQPSSSHFLRYSITPWIVYHKSVIIVSSSPFGTTPRAFTISLDPLSELSERAQGFLGHASWFHLPGRIFLHWPWLLRCFLQDTPHLCTGSTVSVGMCVSYILVSGILLPLLAFLGRFLLLFLVLISPLCLDYRGLDYLQSFYWLLFFLVYGLGCLCRGYI